MSYKDKEKKKAYDKAWREANKEKIKAYNKSYCEANKEKIKVVKKAYDIFYREANNEKIKARMKKYYEANKEKKKAYDRVYYEDNKEKINVHCSIYRKNNRGLLNAYNSKREANKIRATPLWANLEKIKEIYKNCPKGYHVDHIIPLRSEYVCGLHVENNLQYLTAKENMEKSNKIIDKYL